MQLLAEGRDVAFQVEGDASTHSTFRHLARAVRELAPEVEVETIPGIPAFLGIASYIGLPVTEMAPAALLGGGWTSTAPAGLVGPVQLRLQTGTARTLPVTWTPQTPTTLAPASVSQILQIFEVFRANVIDMGNETISAELAAPQGKVAGLIRTLAPHGIQSLSRTGLIALSRGDG